MMNRFQHAGSQGKEMKQKTWWQICVQTFAQGATLYRNCMSVLYRGAAVATAVPETYCIHTLYDGLPRGFVCLVHELRNAHPLLHLYVHLSSHNDVWHA